MINTESKINFFTKEISNLLTPSRFEHCTIVAKLAEEFATVYNYPDPRKAFLAGLVHDITKQLTKEHQLDIFKENNFDSYFSIPENAYHAFTGYLLLKSKYLIIDEELLSSVKNHTLGDKEMSLLDQILYISDFLGSNYAINHPDYKTWIQNTIKDIYYGTYLKSSQTIQELIESKKEIHENTIYVYNQSIVQKQIKEFNPNGI